MMYIAGVDEAGRGALAGPVYAAAVILGDREVAGLADSKTLLSTRRERIAEQIRALAQDWAIASASVAEVDAYNILQAALLAMRRAVEMLRLIPDQVDVDGLHTPPLSQGMRVRALPRADAEIPAVSAASILAKTARDQCMRELAESYPGYGFEVHKGYPTAAHRKALCTLGPSPVHRKTFGPVARLL